MSTNDILTSARCLSDDEQLALGCRLVSEVSQRQIDQLGGNERESLHLVLKERVGGPFNAFPADWKQDVIGRGGELLRERHGSD
ncbi:MAG TPA: hypothetical protein EYQ50_25555 [Verrucomicrobiales bacterium]|jgi:hypothetical protein|nr:hypothetical protein [Verrucomicrobiales bacterium]HIL70914.1 hypothetical protein [Verrucomicrobiota bacterium]